jgi:hypothetical protein
MGSFLNIKQQLPDTAPARWSAKCKQQVVWAVFSGALSLGVVCSQYRLSLDEFLGWARKYSI